MRRKIVRLVTLFALFSMSTTTFAQSAVGGQGNTGDSSGTSAVAGRQVRDDRQTMQLRQLTSEEAKKLVESMRKFLSRSTEELKVVKHPDGSETVDFGDRFQSAFVAKAGSDGKMSGMCVTSAEEAAAFLGISAKATSETPAEKNGTRKAPK